MKAKAKTFTEPGEVTLANLQAYVDGYEEIGTVLGIEDKWTGEELPNLEIQFGHGKIYVATDVKKDMIRAGYFREASFYLVAPSSWPCIKIEAFKRWMRTEKNVVLMTSND